MYTAPYITAAPYDATFTDKADEPMTESMEVNNKNVLASTVRQAKPALRNNHRTLPHHILTTQQSLRLNFSLLFPSSYHDTKHSLKLFCLHFHVHNFFSFFPFYFNSKHMLTLTRACATGAHGGECNGECRTAILGQCLGIVYVSLFYSYH